MARIPVYARQYVPQALPVQPMDRTALEGNKLFDDTAGAVREIYQKQKDIADQASAAKADRDATLAYVGKIEELKLQYKDDPETLTKETVRAGDNIAKQYAETISSPEMRQKFTNNFYGTTTTQTVATMRWSAGRQADRAKNNMYAARIGFSDTLGAATDVGTFEANVASFTKANAETYKNIYGDQANEYMQKDIAAGTEAFYQRQLELNPANAAVLIKEGPLSKNLNEADRTKWNSRADSAIENYDKNLVTLAKLKAVEGAGRLGAKVIAADVKPADVEQELNAVKDDPSVPQEYKDGLSEWLERLYTGARVGNTVTKFETYKRLNKLVDAVAISAGRDPDLYGDAVINLAAYAVKSWNQGELSDQDFNEISGKIYDLRELTAEKKDGIKYDNWSLKPNERNNGTIQSYRKLDEFIESSLLPDEAKAGVKYYLRITYDSYISGMKKIKKAKHGTSALTPQDYAAAAQFSINHTSQNEETLQIYKEE